MALSDAELYRLRAELGDHLLEQAATPYLGYRAVWSVIQDYLAAPTVETTSSTAVASAGPSSIVLASATGFAAGQRVQLDDDEAREVVTVRALTGSTASVLCRKTHSGTYRVIVETAEVIVRGLLADLEVCRQQLLDAASSAGLRRVDEVEWMDGASGRTQLDELRRHQRDLRRALARACGVAEFYEATLNGGAGRFEVY